MAAAFGPGDWPFIQFMLVIWLGAIGLFILLAAAFLYWRRTRHWCLMALAIGALLVVLGTIPSILVGLGIVAAKIWGILFRGDAAAQIVSGSAQAGQSLTALGTWAVFCGFVVAAVGGIGAIHWAIRLRPRD